MRRYSLHRRKNVYFYTTQKESKVLYKRGGNEPTLKERRGQRSEGKGKKRETDRWKKKGTGGWREQGDAAQPTGGVFDGA